LVPRLLIREGDELIPGQGRDDDGDDDAHSRTATPA
jgi:hypothetical protein